MLNPPQDDEPQTTGRRRTVAVAVLGVVVLAAVAVVAVVVRGGGSSTTTAAAANSTTAAPTTTQALVTTTSAVTTTAAGVSGQCAYPASGPAARPVTPPALTAVTTGIVTGSLTTNAGPIPFTLDRAKAPCTVASLISLAGQSYFDNAPCSRLTTAKIFLLQCGDPTGGPGYTVPDELPTAPSATGVYYPRGTIAMANTGTPDTGGGQFFLVYQDSPLPPTYTSFGTVTAAGLSTLDAIAAKGTSNGSTDGPPATPVTILALSGS